MSDEEFCLNWRQVRVFIRDFTEAGFRSFHASVTLPCVQAGLAVPLFVSHYACSDAQDSADTTIQMLPPDFRRPDGCQHSIRVRYRNSDDAEQQLIHAIPPACWYSEFLPFDPVAGLADDRFCDYAADDIASRRRRARIVANLLFYSTRFYLDSLRQDDHGVALETSHCPHNSVLHTPYQSMLHMILNPPLFRDRVVGMVPAPQGQVIAPL